MTRLAPKVLVADDDADLTRILSLVLEERGYAVEVVHDGEQAREVAVRMMPDLILLDVMMPEMDGLEVMAVLKSRAATASIPVVLMTAKAGDDEVWDGWQAGAAYYVTKPFDLDELVRFVDRILGGQTPDRGPIGARREADAADPAES